MLRSLVGSEMCIRDSPQVPPLQLQLLPPDQQPTATPSGAASNPSTPSRNGQEEADKLRELCAIERELTALRSSHPALAQECEADQRADQRRNQSGVVHLPSPIKRLQTLQDNLRAGRHESIVQFRQDVAQVHTPRFEPPPPPPPCALLDQRHLEVLNSPRVPLPFGDYGPRKQVRFERFNNLRY
eukprot:TRINITY_DN55338_c0_g1_i1.p1 TRINITY_DN55338_c0_g1~~TRINITY_DN55338_c0_g1_i1.p1  ORF type:complete len:185 (+),score=32.42 TRINITY_DN55338_c0_g1_i1:87-641(+)